MTFKKVKIQAITQMKTQLTSNTSFLELNEIPFFYRHILFFKNNELGSDTTLLSVRNVYMLLKLLYMIYRRPVSNRRPLLQSASTDVIISNYGPILGYSQIGVLSKLAYLQARLHDQSLP